MKGEREVVGGIREEHLSASGFKGLCFQVAGFHVSSAQAGFSIGSSSFVSLSSIQMQCGSFLLLSPIRYFRFCFL